MAKQGKSAAYLKKLRKKYRLGEFAPGASRARKTRSGRRRKRRNRLGLR